MKKWTKITPKIPRLNRNSISNIYLAARLWNISRFKHAFGPVSGITFSQDLTDDGWPQAHAREIRACIEYWQFPAHGNESLQASSPTPKRSQEE